MSTTISIINVKRAPSGKSLIVEVAGRKEGYFAKLESGLQSGMNVEIETKESFFNGKTNVWIEKWKNAPGPANTTDRTMPSQPPPAAPAPAQEAGRFTAEGVNMAFLPFVSNVVAHAIQAARIEGPADISAWADAAYTAACNLKDSSKEPF